jgi:hypothetical protein
VRAVCASWAALQARLNGDGLSKLLPWLGLGPLLGVWALRPLWRPR